ncbi:acetolactate synthase large subunit [Paenibacillus sp. TRM 82003]|nr:acetolactate synthase large subunit [Paenibacillus sp. TRM 82003]
MRAAQCFVNALEAEGVERVYGVPGEENIDLMDALLESSVIDFVTVHHEQGAAFMAAMEGKLTGRPGVCLSTLGPGATNLLTGVANANMDRYPIVAISGQAAEDRLHKKSHQVYDLRSLFQPVTKWNASVATPTSIPEVVRQAFRAAAEDKPGAAHIVLPEDIAAQEMFAPPLARTRDAFGTLAHPSEIEHAAGWLARAERPLILAGPGVIRGQAGGALKAFAEAANAPVLTTFMGKGALAPDHRLHLATAGAPRDDVVDEAFAWTDLVVAVGFDIEEYPPARWNPEGDKPILHIDTAPPETDADYPIVGGVLGEIGGNLEAMKERLTPQEGRRPNDSFYAELRERIHQREASSRADDAFPLRPGRIVAELRDALGADDILISDVGAHKMEIGRAYPAFEPNTCLISNGFASMGVALPGAIAARLVRSDRRVVAAVGDGAFQMSLNELETAARLKLPIVIVIWNDGGYGLIERKQRATFGRAAHASFGNPNYAVLAQAYGAVGIRIESADELQPALERALQEKDRPTLIDCPVDYAPIDGALFNESPNESASSGATRAEDASAESAADALAREEVSSR